MRFDLISFFIGFVSAAVIAFIIYRLRGGISAVRQSVEQKAGETRQYISNTAEGRYYKFLVNSLNKAHIAHDLADLTDIYIEPKFLQLPAPADPTAEKLLDVFKVVPYIHELPAGYAPYNVPTLSINDLRAGERHLALLGEQGSGRSVALAIIALVAAGEIELPTIDIMTDAVFEEEIKNLPPDERDKQRRQRQELQRRALAQLEQHQQKAKEDKSAEERQAVDFKTLLPIYIHLRDIDLRPEVFGLSGSANGEKSAVSSKKKALDPAEPIVSALQRRAGGVAASTLPKVIYNRLTEGRALVLIDGYDDLPAEDIPVKLAWLGKFIETYRGNFIITAGPATGYNSLISIGLTPCFIRAWSDADYETFVQRWTLAWMGLVKAKRGMVMPEDKLVRRVATNNRGRSPLDVTLKAWAAFANDEQLPGRQGWYDYYIRRKLENVKEARPIAQKFAATILNQGGLTRAKMKEITAAELGGMASNADDTVNKLLNTGLFVDWPGGVYTTIHPVIGGYMAAETLTETSVNEVAMNPAWNIAMPFAAMRLPMDAAVAQRLAAPPDVLFTGLFSTVPWLIDSPANAPWRAEIFKRLAAALIAPSQYPHIRERATAALVTTRDKGIIFVLRQALQSTSPHIRRLGCIGLGALGETDAIKDLTNMLNDSDKDVQLAAGLALAAIGTDTALETMVSALYDGEQGLRRAVAEALAAIPGVGHLTLREAIGAQDMMMRHAAVFGLARIKAAWSLALLYRTLLEDEQWYVRNAAEEAFREIERPERGGISRHPEADSLEWLIAWAADRGDGVPAGLNSRQVLIRVLQEGEPEVRMAAARTLAGLGHVPALKPLYGALRDREEEVRGTVHEALGSLQTRLGQPLPSAV